jgi:hypothetical protein
MSAQTPQTEVSGMALQMASDRTIGEVIAKLQVERDHYKALCEELREALNGTLNLIDNGWLVRNTTEDGTSGWALRQVEPIKRLQEARAALKKAQKDI